MAISSSELEAIIRQNFPRANIKITDLAEDEDHYALEITDESFKGQSLINQHKMVKNALKGVLQEKLHAITIKTKTE
ncbi:MAG: BolA/IbaG family iron-sulfur metabolism protein [Pseudomonadota bacterium]